MAGALWSVTMSVVALEPPGHFVVILSSLLWVQPVRQFCPALLAGINALQQHIQNLLTPSTPFFFNTLYDPFAEGADFVRGYPFSLREGVPTAISHGLSIFLLCITEGHNDAVA